MRTHGRLYTYNRIHMYIHIHMCTHIYLHRKYAVLYCIGNNPVAPAQSIAYILRYRDADFMGPRPKCSVAHRDVCMFIISLCIHLYTSGCTDTYITVLYTIYLYVYIYNILYTYIYIDIYIFTYTYTQYEYLIQIQGMHMTSRLPQLPHWRPKGTRDRQKGGAACP